MRHSCKLYISVVTVFLCWYFAKWLPLTTPNRIPGTSPPHQNSCSWCCWIHARHIAQFSQDCCIIKKLVVHKISHDSTKIPILKIQTFMIHIAPSFPEKSNFSFYTHEMAPLKHCQMNSSHDNVIPSIMISVADNNISIIYN